MERVAELEEKFSDMPLETAEKILTDRGMINETGFFSREGDIFGGKIVSFENADIYIFVACREISGDGHGLKIKVYPLKIDVYAEIYDGVDIGKAVTAYKLDGALFNFIDKKDLIKDYEANKQFVYLKTDKKNFVRSAFGFKIK